MRRGFTDFHIVPSTSMLGSSWLDTREVREGAENRRGWEVPQKGHRRELLLGLKGSPKTLEREWE